MSILYVFSDVNAPDNRSYLVFWVGDTTFRAAARVSVAGDDWGPGDPPDGVLARTGAPSTDLPSTDLEAGDLDVVDDEFVIDERVAEDPWPLFVRAWLIAQRAQNTAKAYATAELQWREHCAARGLHPLRA